MQSTVTHNSVQIIFFPDKINIMQYFYLLNISLSAAPHHMHVQNYEHKSRNYLIIRY